MQDQKTEVPDNIADWQRLDRQDPIEEFGPVRQVSLTSNFWIPEEDPDFITSTTLTNANHRPFPKFIQVSYRKGDLLHPMFLNLDRVETVTDFRDRCLVRLVNGMTYSLDDDSRVKLFTVLGAISYEV